MKFYLLRTNPTLTCDDAANIPRLDLSLFDERIVARSNNNNANEDSNNERALDNLEGEIQHLINALKDLENDSN